VRSGIPAHPVGLFATVAITACSGWLETMIVSDRSAWRSDPMREPWSLTLRNREQHSRKKWKLCFHFLRPGSGRLATKDQARNRPLVSYRPAGKTRPDLCG